MVGGMYVCEEWPKYTSITQIGAKAVGRDMGLASDVMMPAGSGYAKNRGDD